jgi:hypothetical protein
MLHGNWGQEPCQIAYLKRLKKILKGEEELPPAEPTFDICYRNPSLCHLEEWAAKIGPRGVSCDIECAGDFLICIGFCRIDDLVPIEVPFRVQGGGEYWTRRELPHAIKWCDGLLSDPNIPKTFQNGQNFDVPYLRKIGFTVRGYDWDTMLAQHVTYPEMPKGLEFMTKLYCGVPNWKHLIKEEEGEGK